MVASGRAVGGQAPRRVGTPAQDHSRTTTPTSSDARPVHDPEVGAGRASVCSGQACVSSSRARAAVSDGVLPTLTPAASRASFLAWAVPDEPETMAPAWPMVLPSGAVNPAT